MDPRIRELLVQQFKDAYSAERQALRCKQGVAEVAVIFLVCHGIEGYVIAPLVQRNTADLPPALTILSMTILGALLGPLGVILGAPVAAVALVMVREMYVGDVLARRLSLPTST